MNSADSKRKVVGSQTERPASPATGVLSAPTATRNELEATAVSFSYGTGPVILRNIDVTVERGSALGIVGESGSGKSTLASLLVGLSTPSSGSVTVRGRQWSEVRRKDKLRRAVQMVFQNPYTALNPRLTALQTVAEVYRTGDGLSARDAANEARQMLDSVGIGHAAQQKRPSELSGGQCQRTGIARALAARPTVIVADEPTSALDVSVQAQILNLLSDLRREQGVGLVLISHDLNVVSYLTEQAIVLEKGSIVERGETAALLHAPRHPYTQRLLAAVL